MPRIFTARSPFPILLLAVATATATATCADGETSYGEFVASLGGYFADSALLGGFVGARSDGCSLPVTPTDATFQIWGYIYAHEAALSLPTLLEPR